MSEAAPVPTPSPVLSFVDVDLLNKDVKIDPTNLSQELQEHSSKFVYYACRAVDARKQMDTLKHRLEMLEGALDKEIRTCMKEENPKCTEGQIKAAVMIDSRFRAASSRLIDATHSFRMAEAAQSGFEHRRDMLRLLANNAIKENAGPLQVRSNISAKERAESLVERMSATAAAATAAAAPVAHIPV